jgi:hypothetical protein
MNKYFNCVDRKDIYTDTIGDTGYVELWSGWNSNYNEESRTETISTVASLCYGNELAKNPAGLVQLLKDREHGTPFEFVRFGDVFEENLRNLTKAGTDTEMFYWGHSIFDDHKLKDFHFIRRSQFAHFKIKIPLFVDAHFMTHRSFSRVGLSRRYVTPEKVPFSFYCENGSQLVAGANFEMEYQSEIKAGKKPEDARKTMPVNCYTYRFICCDRDGLKNWFKQRCKPDTQKETKELADTMLELLRVHQPDLYNYVKGCYNANL